MGKSGVKWYKVVKKLYFYAQTRESPMITFIGDYTVRLDSKGTALLSCCFKKQSRELLQDGFVLKRDLFENCLIMYPMEEWERQNKIIRSRTNPYNKEHAKFSKDVFFRNG